MQILKGQLVGYFGGKKGISDAILMIKNGLIIMLYFYCYFLCPSRSCNLTLRQRAEYSRLQLAVCVKTGSQVACTGDTTLCIFLLAFLEPCCYLDSLTLSVCISVCL